MNSEEFRTYLRAFSKPDYVTLHTFFSDDVKLQVKESVLRTKPGLKAFYDTFHQYVREEAKLVQFVEGPIEGGRQTCAADIVFRFTGLKDFTEQVRADLAKHSGYGWRQALMKGETFYMENFILYDLVDGKIDRVRAAVTQPPDGAKPIWDATPELG